MLGSVAGGVSWGDALCLAVLGCRACCDIVDVFGCARFVQLCSVLSH